MKLKEVLNVLHRDEVICIENKYYCKITEGLVEYIIRDDIYQTAMVLNSVVGDLYVGNDDILHIRIIRKGRNRNETNK